MKTRLLRCSRGLALIEFALCVPIAVALVLGVVELGYALLDQHVVTRLAREGSNLISRSATLEDAAAAMTSMSSRPVDFANGSKVIFSVIKRGATTGTSNYDQLILYQRHEYGTLPEQSALQTAGSGSFEGPPNYEAVNSDNNPSLRVTNVPGNLIIALGGMIYITEIYTTHNLITPFGGFAGVTAPTTLYSIA